MKKTMILCIALISFNTIVLCTIQKPIVVVVPSYNNINFYQKNLDSLVAQNYENYHIVYVDDHSTDGTAAAVEAYIAEHNLQGKISLIKNGARYGALFNHYIVAHSCPDSAIVVSVDGDDWLAHPGVLARINEVYQDPEVWMTYGQFQEYPLGKPGFCKPLSAGVKKLRVYRDCGFTTSHLRTYYAGLFKQIPVGYFIRNGSFLRSACDVAIMFALLELADGRAAFIEEVLYVYNCINSESDCRTRPVEQLHNDYWARSRASLLASPVMPQSATQSVTVADLYGIHLSDTDCDMCRTYFNTLEHLPLERAHMQLFYTVPVASPSVGAYQEIACAKNIGGSIGVEETVDFKTILLCYLATLPDESYLLVTTDRCSWHSSWDAAAALCMLIQTKAVCCSCSRDYDTQEDPIIAGDHTRPIMTPITGDFSVWKPAEAKGTWHFPYASEAFVINTKRFRSLITHIRGATIDELLSNLALLAVDNSDDVVLCAVHAASTDA